MKMDNTLGLMYLAEETSPSENVVKNLEIHDKNGVFYASFFSALHTFDLLNRNSRLYKAYNIDEHLKSERIQHFLKHHN